MKKKQLLTCRVCGKKFYRPPSEVARGCVIACSKECRSEWRKRGSMATCAVCGKNFYRKKSQAIQGYGIYCSRECFFEARKQRKTFSCVVCGNSFERRPWQIAKGYTKVCSKDCMTIYRRGENPNIRINLFTEKQKQEWKDDHCCRCGTTKNLQLDHIIPRAFGGLPTKENAQTLCRKCNLEKYWTEDRPRYLLQSTPTRQT